MRRYWTAAEDRELRMRYATQTAQSIADGMGVSLCRVQNRVHKLRLSKSAEWKAACTRDRWRDGRHERSRARQFKPGAEPWNKGAKGSTGTHPNCRRTQFKKGERLGAAQRNYVPVGTLRISADGYLERKVTDDPSIYPARRWVGVHRLVWEAANGKVPRGHVVVFRPGMRSTEESAITLDCVELVSRPDLMRRNTIYRYPPELVSAMKLRGALNRKINNRMKGQS